MKSLLACLLLLTALLLAGAQRARPTATSLEPELCYPSALVWLDGPASLPAGAKYAALEGDPTKEGPFTMRLRLPAGFRIPPHTHPSVERVTVISGSFHLGTGDRFDAGATREMTAGTFGFWPPGMKHFAWTKGETVLQLHGTGPWRIEYLNPADDPRKR